ncbi:MAG: tRNA (N6-threonylcarbamoyladenosine(37)-N6)-methyltransferase TrmO [Clostridia bacterium]|nr:tRNA (N6-threonylcarbamoyladenosine(37)-N6)-methyltransferase TrmO [Clostridia bacterium]
MKEIKPVAHIKNAFKDKFGIPRQSGKAKILSTIEFEKEFSSEIAVKCLDGFSHIWLIFGFSKTNGKYQLSVRPPRLGGNKKVGVFASRSPYRPNGLGLSSVKLERVEKGRLIVSGADLLDGTPIYDIKPYLTFTDCHEDANCGYAQEFFNYKLKVENQSVLDGLEKTVKQDIITCLENDPRPSYQTDESRVYGMTYGEYNVKFTVSGDTLYIKEITK